MINGETYLNIKKNIENDPVAFVEEFYPGLKLYPWQKTILRLMNSKEKLKECFIPPYRFGRDILLKGQIEYMKTMEMDFNVWTKDGIEVYEKGKLVKTIKKSLTHSN